MKLAWGAILTPAERDALIAVARDVGCDPSELSAVIYFESRWDPTAVNASYGATGLIQFVPSTARNLGTTVEDLAGMSRVDQLRYVLAYLRPYAGRIGTLSDLYMAVLRPSAIGKPNDFALITSAEGKAYVANKGLDLNADGNITKQEATEIVRKRLALGLQPGNVYDDGQADKAAPIEDRSTTYQPTEDKPMGAIGLPFLQMILPQVLGLFSGRAQAKIAQVTGADPVAAEQFLRSLIGQVGQVSGVPVTNESSALQAVAKVTAASDPAQIKTLEDHSLDYLDKLAPLLDKIAEQERAAWKQSDDSADRAATRGQRDKVDIGPQLARWAMSIFALAAIIVGGVMIIQVYVDPTHKVDGVLIGLLTILVYAAARIAESPFRYRFGGTAESSVVDSGNVIVRDASQQQTRGKQ